MRNFFQKKEKMPAFTPEFDYDSVNAGYLNCSNCSTKLYFENLTPLSYSNCPNCDERNFIPMLMEKYWLFLPIDSGGVGCVYKAFDIETGRTCAVKTLLEEAKKDEMLVKAFSKEAEIGLEICSHLNICTVVGYGLDEEEYYMASDFIDGVRLDILISEKGVGMDDETVLFWGLQILSALQHIYNCGYLYRDLKPQNLIVSDDGKKIILYDFGLCIKIDQIVDDSVDCVEGSPQYLPPERCNFEKEDMYSEIYSLGMVLFFCITGVPCFTGNSPEKLLEQHVRQLRLKSVFERLENSNPDIAVIIEKMVKRNPEERFQTYSEVVTELETIYEMYHSC